MSYIVAIKALSVFYLLSSRCSMVYPLNRMYRHLPASKVVLGSALILATL
jgi:hypothetical protein